jgi:hypothetical protein
LQGRTGRITKKAAAQACAAAFFDKRMIGNALRFCCGHLQRYMIFIASQEISATFKQHICDMQFNVVAVALKS